MISSVGWTITTKAASRKVNIRQFVKVAVVGASSLLLFRPSTSNAFVTAGISFSSGNNNIPTATTTETTKMSATGKSELPVQSPKPKAVSVNPGESPVEEQLELNPINDSCTVLVVGSTRGIGIEFVKQCLGKGATVIASHRSKNVPESLIKLGSQNDNLHTLRIDLENEWSISDAAKELQSRKDSIGRPLTHIIHNAGIYLSGSSYDGTARAGRPAAPKVTKDVMMKTFEINTIGPMLVAQHFGPLMAKRSDTLYPVLSFVTSKVGSVDDNGSGGAYAYRSSKSALNIIAKSLSIDLIDDVRVVLLHPGYVQTDMTNGKGLIDTTTSVSGMIKAIENTISTTGFRFVDYKANQIPW